MNRNIIILLVLKITFLIGIISCNYNHIILHEMFYLSLVKPHHKKQGAGKTWSAQSTQLATYRMTLWTKISAQPVLQEKQAMSDQRYRLHLISLGSQINVNFDRPSNSEKRGPRRQSRLKGNFVLLLARQHLFKRQLDETSIFVVIY